MEIKEEVNIILLSYRNYDDTIECLNSLLKLNYHNFRIFIIENSENTLFFNKLDNYFLNEIEQLTYRSLNEDNLNKYYGERLLLIKANENRGFSAGNNIGLNYILKYASTNSFVWLLNNDTTVEKQTLTNLLEYYNEISKNVKLGILGAKLLYFHNPRIIQALGGIFYESLFISTHFGEGKDRDSIIDGKIDYVIGASMFFSYKFLSEVGVLSEDYFLYYEELDWVYRSKEFNYTIDYCEEAIVYHKEGASIGSSSSGEKSDFSEVELFLSRQKFVRKFYKIGIRYYFSTSLLIFNRLRKGKFNLCYKLSKMMLKNEK